jgi:hypothetical protein
LGIHHNFCRIDDLFIGGRHWPDSTSHRHVPYWAGISHLFHTIISWAKIIGVVAILIPGLNKTIKEWAYAGLFFDLLAATYSGVAASPKFDPAILGMLMWIVPGILSYIFLEEEN